MFREITGSLRARDVLTSATIALEPGVIVSDCHLLHNHNSSEPYVMQFQYAGRLFSCPLVYFQPRTQFTEK